MSGAHVALAARASAPDLAALPDWRVAELLNAPDPSLPEVVTLEETLLGPAGIMIVLGPDRGAVFLSAVEAAAQVDPKMKWVFWILKDGGLNTAHAFVREGIDGLVDALVLTPADATALKQTAERRRHPSWAEHNGVEVTARTVGLARGAKE